MTLAFSEKVVIGNTRFAITENSTTINIFNRKLKLFANVLLFIHIIHVIRYTAKVIITVLVHTYTILVCNFYII